MPEVTRPAAVPAEARWNVQDKEWELGTIDGKGDRQGGFTYWRMDGTVVNQCLFIEGVPQGIFLRYHENGEISQKGFFVNGEIFGDRIYYRSKAKTTENFPGGCAPSVWKMIFSYMNNQITKQSCFDEAGLEVLPGGEPMPALPAHLPVNSFFNIKNNCWEYGELFRETDTSKPIKTGLWSYWTKDGVLFQEICFHQGAQHGLSKTYDKESGKLVLEEPFNEGKRHGFVKNYDPESGDLKSEEEFSFGKECGLRKLTFAEAEFIYPGIWEGSGQILGSKKIGLWSFYLTPANPERVSHFDIDFGIECNAEDLIDIGLMNFDSLPKTMTAEYLWTLADKNIRDRKYSVALFCHLRAAVLDNSRGELNAFLKAYCVPFSFPRAYGEADGCGKVWSRLPFNNENPEHASATFLLLYLNQIIAGAAPEKMLQQAAIYFDQNGQHSLALEIIQTALLIAPERVDFGFNAGLIAMSLGMPDRVFDFSKLLEKKQVKLHAYLTKYASMVFTPLSFQSPSHPLSGYLFSNSIFGNVDCKIHASLESVQQKVLDSMGWLSVLREVLVEKMHFTLKETLKENAQALPWLPTDYSAQVGPEVMAAQRSERARVDSLAIPDVLKEVKLMQDFLATLCWMVGLDSIEPPLELNPRAELNHFVPEAYGRTLFLEDFKSGMASPLPEYQYYGHPVSYWPNETMGFLESSMHGLTGAIHFLCVNPATGQGPIESSFFERFYKETWDSKAA